MAKLNSFPDDMSAWLASFLTLALIFVIGAHARAWAPLDVTWTQSLHEEVKVATDRFTGGAQGDHPDWIAAHCGRGAAGVRDIGSSRCPQR